jgi:hypothetical protein
VLGLGVTVRLAVEHVALNCGVVGWNTPNGRHSQAVLGGLTGPP